MKKSTYVSIAVAVVALLGAIYFYGGSKEELPARARFIDTFDEEPSVSCSNLVMTAWSANQLAVVDELKVALNNIFHSRGITAPIAADQFDDLVSENDTQIKELFTRAGHNFYSRCEDLMLKYFAECEKENLNQSDFLKCWVDSGTSEGQKELYRSLTESDDLTLPDVDEEPVDPAPPEAD